MKKDTKREEFKLRIMGVSLGKHFFSMSCNTEFFDIAGMDEVKGGELTVAVEMDKRDTFLTISFHFAGAIQFECDRCTDLVKLPLDFNAHLHVNFSSKVDHIIMEDEIWVAPENCFELDLFHFVYECINLAIPIKIAHEVNEDGSLSCNAEMLKKIEEYSRKEDKIDPRWDVLKNLKTKITN